MEEGDKLLLVAITEVAIMVVVTMIDVVIVATETMSKGFRESNINAGGGLPWEVKTIAMGTTMATTGVVAMRNSNNR